MTKAKIFPEIKSQSQIDWESAGALAKATILLNAAFCRAGSSSAYNHVQRTFSVLGLN